MYKSLFLLWIICVDLSSALITQIPYFIFFILEISIVPSRKQRCYLSHGSPCTLYFQDIVCPKPYFLILICHFLNSMSKFSLPAEPHTNSISKL